MECRVCASDQKLIDTYDSRFKNGESIRAYVRLATDIEITENDPVGTKVCSACLKMTFNMFLFRKKAHKNDKALREKYGVPPKNGKTLEQIENNSNTLQEDKVKFNEDTFGNAECEVILEKRDIVHPTVEKVLTAYPKIVLADEVLNCNIDPKVSLVRCEEPIHDEESEYVDVDVMTEEIREPPAKKPKLTNTSEKNIYNCKYCTATFTNRKHFNRHETNHRREMLENDLIKETEARANLNHSLMVVAEVNAVHICEICTKSYNSKGALTRHMSEHNASTVSSHICSVCEMCYYSESALLEHMSEHPGCQYCSTNFKSVSDVEEHTKACEAKVYMENCCVQMKHCDKDKEVLIKYWTVFTADNYNNESTCTEPSNPISTVQDEDDYMDYMIDVFETERLKDLAPTCITESDVIKLKGVDVDLSAHRIIEIEFCKNPKSTKLSASIVPYRSKRIKPDPIFDFTDLELISIKAPGVFVNNLPKCQQILSPQVKTMAIKLNNKLQAITITGGNTILNNNLPVPQINVSSNPKGVPVSTATNTCPPLTKVNGLPFQDKPKLTNPSTKTNVSTPVNNPNIKPPMNKSGNLDPLNNSNIPPPVSKANVLAPINNSNVFPVISKVNIAPPVSNGTILVQSSNGHIPQMNNQNVLQSMLSGNKNYTLPPSNNNTNGDTLQQNIQTFNVNRIPRTGGTISVLKPGNGMNQNQIFYVPSISFQQQFQNQVMQVQQIPTQMQPMKPAVPQANIPVTKIRIKEPWEINNT